MWKMYEIEGPIIFTIPYNETHCVQFVFETLPLSGGRTRPTKSQRPTFFAQLRWHRLFHATQPAGTRDTDRVSLGRSCIGTTPPNATCGASGPPDRLRGNVTGGRSGGILGDQCHARKKSLSDPKIEVILGPSV